jgi:hypothetical protein
MAPVKLLFHAETAVASLCDRGSFIAIPRCNNPFRFALLAEAASRARRALYVFPLTVKGRVAMFKLLNELISNAEMSSVVIKLISIGALILVAAGTWRVYEKAGEPGWASLIPIYNLIVWLRIAGERWWCILLYAIPGINVIVHILVLRDVARRFGKGALFAVGLCIAGFVFLPILGFGGAEYQKPL